ncbi:hypothetical protein K438DRAFT_1989092 [Mycena galopus ATCC 62051]|nr:hypothetical protein K438DRAFT_1989092 [Mycena galopus ATCC 62051]
MAEATKVMQRAGWTQLRTIEKLDLTRFIPALKLKGSQWKKKIGLAKDAALEAKIKNAPDGVKAKRGHKEPESSGRILLLDSFYFTKYFKAKEKKAMTVVDSVVTEYNLNAEQERAFRLVANHAIADDPDQLKMHLDGDGFGPPMFPSPLIFYSTIPILDSNNQTSPWVNLSGFGGPPAIQPFRCSLSLVQQTATLNSTTRALVSVEPAINKTISTWQAFSGGSTDFSDIAFANPQGFLDIWEAWYSVMPTAVPPPALSEITAVPFSVADVGLLQQLNLFPFNSTLKTTVYLHELENQLANIVASMFWTLGHVPTLPAYDPPNLATNSASFNVSLLVANAIIEEIILQERLNLSVIAIIGGLLASIALMSLTIQFLSFATTTRSDVQPEGLNMLHSIWLYRNHPELHACLRQVAYPTDFNLREAGMSAMLIATFNERNAKAHASETGPKSTILLFPARNSYRNSSLVSAVLHVSLVAIHLALLAISRMELEHEITFPLTRQAVVSWAITTIATTFVTIYLAVLLFMTQTLAFQRSLRKLQMITATHDNIAAWDGIGSALVQIWHQKAVPASVFGVLSAFAYLAGVLVLHITSPALLSVQPFEVNYLIPVTTQSLPTFTLSGYDPASLSARIDKLHSPLLYAEGSLSFLPFLNSTAPLGLHGATLYDVLELNSGAGNVTVDATRFDMTCGYIPDAIYTSGTIDILGTLYHEAAVPILDSNGNTSPLTDDAQLFACSAKPAKLVAIVDSQSRELIYIDQEMNNAPSIWEPFDGNSNNSTNSNSGPEQTLADNWESWYPAMPVSPSENYVNYFSFNVAEAFFMEQLDLAVRANITLGEFENTLSALVASMYWTLGHIAPPPGFTPTSLTPSGPPPVEVSLLQGSAEVTETTVEARLDLSTTAIASGILASAILLLVSLQFLDFRKSREHDDDIAISGMGLLHAVWLYREHPELEKLLEQVVEPTDENLRRAGMVQMRLAGSGSGKRQRPEPELEEAED